jgi:hypothetical protein
MGELHVETLARNVICETFPVNFKHLTCSSKSLKNGLVNTRDKTNGSEEHSKC